MDWVLSAITVVMMVLLGRKNKWGWVLSAVSSLLWIYYAITIEQYGLIPSSVVLGVNACISAYKWFKDDGSLDFLVDEYDPLDEPDTEYFL